MKVQNITDIDKFFKVVDSCKGKVELVTGEGDRLNLKSKLSQCFHGEYLLQRRDPGAGDRGSRAGRYQQTG